MMAKKWRCECGKGKAYGRMDAVVVVTCGSGASVAHLLHNFGGRASGKTLTWTMKEQHTARGHDRVVVIEMTHICHNGGNAHSDIKRFVHKAFEGTTFRYDLRVQRPTWKELPCPEMTSASATFRHSVVHSP
jgi:hypothetical protein